MFSEKSTNTDYYIGEWYSDYNLNYNLNLNSTRKKKKKKMPDRKLQVTKNSQKNKKAISETQALSTQHHSSTAVQ